MGKLIQFSVHKNTHDKRQFRHVRQSLRDHAHFLPQGTVGYALVTWGKNYEAVPFWDSGGAMPNDVLPEFVKRIMERAVSMDDAKDAVFGREPDDNSA